MTEQKRKSPHPVMAAIQIAAICVIVSIGIAGGIAIVGLTARIFL